MACPNCDQLVASNRELTKTNAVLAQMLRELLDHVEVTLEKVRV